jgi:hypothetical protein
VARSSGGEAVRRPGDGTERLSGELGGGSAQSGRRGKRGQRGLSFDAARKGKWGRGGAGTTGDSSGG